MKKLIVSVWIIGALAIVGCSNSPGGENNSGNSSPAITTDFVLLSVTTNSLGTNGLSVLTNAIPYPASPALPVIFSNFIITNAESFPFEVITVSNELTNSVYLCSITNYSYFTNYSGAITNFISLTPVNYQTISMTNVFSTNAFGSGSCSVTNSPVVSNFSYTTYNITNRISTITNGITNTIYIYSITNYSYYLSDSFANTNWLNNNYFLYTNGGVVYSNTGNAWLVLTNSNPSGNISILSSIIGNPVTAIGNYAFYVCSNMTGINIPSTVTSIGRSAFWGCSGLTGMDIPTGVMSIGMGAFCFCTALTNINIPSSVTNIGLGVFCDCTGLTGITVDNGNTYYSSLSGVLFNDNQTTLIEYPGGLNGSYSIPSGVTNIRDYAFYDCTGLTGITIPSSVSIIGSYTFYGCTGLSGITIPSSVSIIGSYTFYGCTGLSDITIPSSVTSFGNNVFQNCSWLTNITLPPTVTSFGMGIFLGCSRLTGTLTLPSGITNIGDNTFNECRKLTGVNIPSGVLSIGIMAFNNCTGLTNIIIPSSTKSIGIIAFGECSNLITIYDNATTPQTITSAIFIGCKSLIVKVPDGGSPTYVSVYSNAWISYLPSGSIIMQQ